MMTTQALTTFSAFDLLPSELFILIISFAVHLTDFNNDDACLRFPYTALHVSKHWSTAAQVASEAWTVVSICADESASRIERRLDLHWERSRGMSLHLQLHIEFPSFGTPNSFQVLQRKMQSGMRLKSFQMSSFNAPFGSLIRSLFSPATENMVLTNTVHELHLINPALRDWGFLGRQVDETFLGALPQLRRLHFSRISVHPAGRTIPTNIVTLHELRYICMDDVDPQAVMLLFRTRLPNLATLAIRCHTYPHKRPEESFIPPTYYQASLHTAILYDVDTRDTKTLLSGAPHLQCLAVSSLDYWWDLGYLADTRVVPELSSLTIFSPWKLDSQVYEVVKSRSSVLKRLTMHDGALLDAVEDEEFGQMMEWMGDYAQVRLLPTDELAFAYLAALAVP